MIQLKQKQNRCIMNILAISESKFWKFHMEDRVYKWKLKTSIFFHSIYYFFRDIFIYEIPKLIEELKKNPIYKAHLKRKRKKEFLKILMNYYHTNFLYTCYFGDISIDRAHKIATKYKKLCKLKDGKNEVSFNYEYSILFIKVLS